MSSAPLLRKETESTLLTTSYLEDRDNGDHSAEDRDAAPFQRALLLLRGTRSRITLCQVSFWGEVTQECGVLLHELFGQDAMIDQVDPATYILLFVRRHEDEQCVEQMVLRRLGQVMQPADGRRFHATLSASHHDSETLGDSEDLLAELAVEEKKGPKIVAI